MLAKQPLFIHMKGLLHPKLANRGLWPLWRRGFNHHGMGEFRFISASQPMMEPGCSSPQTLTGLFSDSGSDRRKGTPSAFASLKRLQSSVEVCLYSKCLHKLGGGGGRGGGGGWDPGVASTVL